MLKISVPGTHFSGVFWTSPLIVLNFWLHLSHTVLSVIVTITLFTSLLYLCVTAGTQSCKELNQILLYDKIQWGCGARSRSPSHTIPHLLSNLKGHYCVLYKHYFKLCNLSYTPNSIKETILHLPVNQRWKLCNSSVGYQTEKNLCK